MSSGKPTNQIIIFNVPSTVPQEHLTASVKEIVPDAVIQTCIPLRITNSSSGTRSLANYKLTFKSESSAQKVVEKKMLNIDGHEFKVGFYILNPFKSVDSSFVLVVSGFTGSDEDLKNTLKEGNNIKSIYPFDENQKLVVFDNDSSAKVALDNASNQQDKQYQIRNATKEDIQSISQKYNPPTDAEQKLEDDPRNICMKGRIVYYLNEDLIKKLLEPYDSKPIIKIHPPKFDPSQRMAFVTLSSEENAKKAIETLNEKPLPENILSIITQQPSQNNQDLSKLKEYRIIVEHIQNTKTSAAEKSTAETSHGDTTVHFHLLGFNPDPTQEMLEEFLINQAKVIVKNLNFTPFRTDNPSKNRFRASGYISEKDFNALQKHLNKPGLPSLYRWQLSYFDREHKKNLATQQANPAYPIMAPTQNMSPFMYSYPNPYAQQMQYQYMQQSMPQTADYSQSAQYGNRQYLYPPQTYQSHPNPHGVYRNAQQNMRKQYADRNQSQPLLQLPDNNNAYNYNRGYPAAPEYGNAQQPMPRSQQDVASAVAASQPMQNAQVNAQLAVAVQPQMHPAIDVERIKKMNKEDQREEIGEIIYNRANELYNDGNSASKIAGMLLEFDFEQLEPILKNEQLLQQNIEEAKKVLDNQSQ